MAASKQSAATAHAMRSRFFRFITTGAGTPACEPASAIQRSCSTTSCADWKRSSGSFAMQVRTTRSSAGGVSGTRVAIGGGSLASTAAITLACVLPLKARLPVSIS